MKETTEPEAQLIQKIVEEVSTRLNRTRALSIARYPVGLEYHIEKINPFLGIGVDDEVRMIGIYGEEGIGKSTIARAIFNLHCHRFEGGSFLAQVKACSGAEGHGLVKVQETLLCETLGLDSISLGNSYRGVSVIKQRLWSKKVLLVIDDVDDLDQLRQLAGGNEWFGPGSRIIITTRNKDLLQAHGVAIEHSCEVDRLNNFYSSLLFCWNTFRKLDPPEMFVELSQCIVEIVQGVPKRLITKGSSLYGKGAKEWGDVIMELWEASNGEGWDKILKIAIDGLEQLQRAILLVIAYVLNGKDKEEIMDILDISESLFNTGIEDLTSKSLICIQRNKIWVSESLRELAREILHAMSQIKFRLMCILRYLDDATDELEDDINSAARSLFKEIFKDSEGEEVEGEEDVISELTNETGLEEGIDDFAEDIESFIDEAFSFFS
ncbi:hypothetical protein CRG98_026603 [Punica granatum]|uniref:NB-ARC domain-containing protein n=1 Tax=Punica granatum TaxID=22663 RepID=A0A2I0JAL3_PUNGR|nr:hypothetical protein CRG98_026603 [Punica granatum]